MNFEKLAEYLKQKIGADNSVSPEEVYNQLQKNRGEDPNKNDSTESVDSELVADNNSTLEKDTQENMEGDVIEKAFPELEIEVAITQAKEVKKRFGPSMGQVKEGSCWDILKKRYGNNRR